MLHFRHPITRADFDLPGFSDWLADRIADIAITGFGFGLVGSAADLAALCFVNRFANRAADIAVARLVAGLADRAADIAVTRLEAGLADRTANIAIARLVTGLADRVALIAIAGVVNIACAGYGNLLAALFVDGAAAVDRLLLIHGFAHRLVASTAAALRRTVIAIGSAGVGRTASCAGRSAVEGFDSSITGEHQQTRCDDYPGGVSHRSVLVPVRTAKFKRSITECL